MHGSIMRVETLAIAFAAAVLGACSDGSGTPGAKSAGYVSTSSSSGGSVKATGSAATSSSSSADPVTATATVSSAASAAWSTQSSSAASSRALSTTTYTVSAASSSLAGSCDGGAILANPSFEQPQIPAGGYTLAPVGSDVSGWLVAGTSGNVTSVSSAYVDHGFFLEAEDGVQWMDLTGTSNSATGVQQTVCTVPGQAYVLSFWIGNVVDPTGNFGTTSSVIVQLNGVPVYTATNTGGAGTKTLYWQSFAVVFTAAAEHTTIAFINDDPPSDTCNALDNVTLAAGG
jgi:hypothetical protein